MVFAILCNFFTLYTCYTHCIHIYSYRYRYVSLVHSLHLFGASCSTHTFQHQNKWAVARANVVIQLTDKIVIWEVQRWTHWHCIVPIPWLSSYIGTNILYRYKLYSIYIYTIYRHFTLYWNPKQVGISAGVKNHCTWFHLIVFSR